MFNTYKKQIEHLENEVNELRSKNLELLKEKLALENKLFNLYARELDKKLIDELDLSSLQRAKLALWCSIEKARLIGVSEDKILHNLEEIDEFFSPRES